jgi:hypothetical protein
MKNFLLTVAAIATAAVAVILPAITIPPTF